MKEMKEMKDIEEIKLILLGESGVGKTSIIKRYLYDEFSEFYNPNISMNYVEKDIELNKKTIRLNIWDTIGQEKYRSVSKLFLKETQIVVLVYSINDLKSFQALNYWNDLYKNQMGKNNVLGVAGNKADLFLEQQITEAEGKQYAEDNNGIFAIISAKEDKIGIDEFILKLVNKYLEEKKNVDIDEFEVIEDREKGIILSNQKLKDLGYNEDGCCGGKAKKRRKKYEEILKNDNGYIESIFLGLGGVGKTSLIKNIEGKKFDEKENHTEETTKYETKYTNGNMQLVLNIYDINNEDKRNKNNETIIKKCQIFFLVYELNDMRTFSEVKFWLQVIENSREEEIDKKKNIIFVIIENKNDLNNKNQLNINDNDNDNETVPNIGENLANEINGIFYSTSAKNDKNFKDIIGIAIEKYISFP